MEQDDMASENRDDQRIVTGREQLKGSKPATGTSQHGHPPLNDGPELLRSNHC
jgi:hypothetical protein